MIEDLRKIDARLDRLLEKARRAIEPAPAANRELFTHAQVALRVPAVRAFEKQQGTFYNGSPSPFQVRRMQVGLTINSDGNIPLFRLQDGWCPALPALLRLGPFPNVRFDFVWNYNIGRRQTTYSRDLLVASDALVGEERGQCLNFKTPFVVMPGEQMTFEVQPTLFYNGGGSAEHDEVQINFALLGYREDDL